jgi:uncharacterized protein (TIGR02246 family)
VTTPNSSHEQADAAVLRRLDRIESTLAIQRLAHLYSQAIDARDFEAVVSLFDEDGRLVSVRAGTARGRAALRENWERLFRTFGPTIHLVASHRVDFDDDDEAHGVVYARAEHEVGNEWIVQTFQYWDHYVRRDGTWQFLERRILPWYAVDQRDAPLGPRKMRWPGLDHAAAPLPAAWETWRAFEAPR